MKVTTKGQVTIPQQIRDKYNITAHSEVDFIDENGKIYLIKQKKARSQSRFNSTRGTASVKMTTDEIMALTREDK